MTRLEQIDFLIEWLLKEMPEYRQDAKQFTTDDISQRKLLRSLMNVRPPTPLSKEILTVQDELLTAEAREKGIVSIDTLPSTKRSNIFLWQGDITRLASDAIVNAANSALLGCFIPCHGCIDNAIHSAAGLQLREECRQIMSAQGHEEATGGAKLTAAYNLPARYVMHTVGPVIRNEVTECDRVKLAYCYRSCLSLAVKEQLKNVAFCCISTGEFHFPNQEAAEIAVHEVEHFLRRNDGVKVIFNVFKENDYDIYKRILN